MRAQLRMAVEKIAVMCFSAQFCLLLLVFCHLFSSGIGIWFSEEEQKLLNTLLEEYTSHADHDKCY